MKTKKINKKLSLNRQTVSKLNGIKGQYGVINGSPTTKLPRMNFNEFTERGTGHWDSDTCMTINKLTELSIQTYFIWTDFNVTNNRRP